MSKAILIIDDNLDILESLKFLLEEEGYRVQTDSVGTSLHNLSSKPTLPDLIILDLLLSGSYGTVYAEKLKREEKTKNIPIILMSAHPSATRYIEKKCVNEFFPKPLDIDKFIQRVNYYTQ